MGVENQIAFCFALQTLIFLEVMVLCTWQEVNRGTGIIDQWKTSLLREYFKKDISRQRTLKYNQPDSSRNNLTTATDSPSLEGRP